MALLAALEAMAPTPSGLEGPPPPSLEHALADLADATHQVGLKELRMPLATRGSPQRLADLAAGLRRANAELSALSGWSGPVLGLDGRVGLTPGTVGNAILDGHDPTGQHPGLCCQAPDSASADPVSRTPAGQR